MREHNKIDWSETAAFGFDVLAAEFVVVTADATDLEAYAPLAGLLRRMRGALGIEFAFITEWAAGEPVVRYRGEGDLPECDALHGAYGRRLLESMGVVVRSTFHSEPVVTADGVMHGTLCCRIPHRLDDECAARALLSVAELIAAWFSDADLALSDLSPLQGHSVMGGLPTPLH